MTIFDIQEKEIEFKGYSGEDVLDDLGLKLYLQDGVFTTIEVSTIATIQMINSFNAARSDEVLKNFEKDCIDKEIKRIVGVFYTGWVENPEYLERWYKARGYNIVQYNGRNYLEKKL